jgi:diguanylate cyclase (GGDEF)-like protein
MSSAAPSSVSPETGLAEALRQAQAASSAARFAPARDLAVPVFHQARDAGAWREAAAAALVLSRAQGALQAPEEALRWAHEALQSAQQGALPELECAAWVALATEHARQERGGLAQQALDEVMRLIAELQSPQALEQALLGLTSVYSELGLSLRAVHFARQALAAVEPFGDLPRSSMARSTLLIIGGVACETLVEADPEAARELLAELWPQLERLRAEAARLASPMAQARVHRVAGTLHNCQRDWPQALAEFEALRAFEPSLPAPLACSMWIELGLVQRRLGMAEAALASGRAAQACNPVPEHPQRAVDIRRLALIEDLLGNPQRSLELLRRYQDRRQHIVMTAMESRVAALSARLDGQTLRVENRFLREQNASLVASVEQMSEMASTDPLTGLLNRRGFEAAWSVCARPDRRRVLALIDLDHFKQINDRHSHAVGDAVLRRVAQLAQATLRGHDRLARHGGEEFSALLLDVDPAPAAAALERLREAVQRFDWSTVAVGLTVTLSGGMVVIRADESLEDALHRADALLYRAKGQGRNRIDMDAVIR